MEFSRFLLDNYLCTSEGKKALTFFNNFETIVKNKKCFTFRRFLKRIYFDKNTILSIREDIMKTPRKLSLKRVCKEKKIFYSGHSFSENIELATKHMQEIADSSELSLREKLTYITYFSVLCHLLSPEHFFPYFFNTRFNHLEDIFSLFSIPLPPLPGKTNYEKRFDFYFELCKVLYEFRLRYSLTYQELNVLLYCFAPHCTETVSLSAASTAKVHTEQPEKPFTGLPSPSYTSFKPSTLPEALPTPFIIQIQFIFHVGSPLRCEKQIMWVRHNAMHCPVKNMGYNNASILLGTKSR